MLDTERIEVCGVPVDCLTMAHAAALTERWIDKEDHPLAIFAVNPEKIIRAQHEPELLAALRRAGMLIPDGIGVVLAARLLGLGRMQRVPGSELMPAICELAARKGYRVFLFGASPKVSEEVGRVLPERYAGLRIAGWHHGFVKDDGMLGVIEKINGSKTDILFVALGSPKQELWVARYLTELKVKVCQGVGGTFDVIAGEVKRAPKFFIRMHLEWLYRLLSQPKRICRQTALPRFVIQVIKAMIFNKDSQKRG